MMIDALRLIIGWALPWALGIALTIALQRRSQGARSDGQTAWIVGCGWFVGAFALTLWMRALSLVGIRFSIASIGIPLAVATIALVVYLLRGTTGAQWRAWVRDDCRALLGSDQGGWNRTLWFAVLGWLVFRSLLLLIDIVSMPLYPWDAWIQWATKARVWFELGRIVPFERGDAWFVAAGNAWLDAAPNYPATVPLWQVWTNVTLSRWDDSLMNVPWWLVAVALTFVVYGVLRRAGYGAIGALVGTWLVTSLPLANVHVALAGYADLPMAAFYALAAIAVWHWTEERTLRNAILACILALACIMTKTPGIVWTLTLVPAIVLALAPRIGPRILAGGLGVALVALIVLARTDAVVLGYRLHLDFAPPWLGMFESLFLLGNWHLLWYGAVTIAIAGWREVVGARIAPLSATIASALLFLFVVFAFTNARAWVTDQTTVNRATLHLALLLSIWFLIVFHAWYARLRSAAETPVPTPA
jgi:hypothetical protein